MRIVKTRKPSFPEADEHVPLDHEAGAVWQVLCGDEDHWRVGMYSPALSSIDEVEELELHDCPELFLLISGRMTLVLHLEGEVRCLELEAQRPVLVTGPHTGFCPDGPHTGTAFVVERDEFETEYRTVEGWRFS